MTAKTVPSACGEGKPPDAGEFATDGVLPVRRVYVCVYKGPVADVRAQLAVLRQLHTTSDLLILTAACLPSSPLPRPPRLCVLAGQRADLLLLLLSLPLSLSLARSLTRVRAHALLLTYIRIPLFMFTTYLAVARQVGSMLLKEEGRRARKGFLLQLEVQLRNAWSIFCK